MAGTLEEDSCRVLQRADEAGAGYRHALAMAVTVARVCVLKKEAFSYLFVIFRIRMGFNEPLLFLQIPILDFETSYESALFHIHRHMT